jgi:hypothetical protein
LFVPFTVAEVLEFDTAGADLKYEANALEFLNRLTSILSAIMAMNTLAPFMLVSMSIGA